MLLHILYLIGITAEAMTGALAAGRRRMDTFGVIIIATATALGGGSVRDILLGHYPLGWVKHPEYVIIVAVAASVNDHCCAGHAPSAPPVSGPSMPWAWWYSRLSAAPNRAGYGRRTGDRLYCRSDYRRIWRRTAGQCSASASRWFSRKSCMPASLLRQLSSILPCSITSASHDVVVISTLLFGFTARMLALRWKLGLPVFHYNHNAH
ncbi:Predicted membrane protein [Raoultella planticola]|uniref:Predicted membrane protein n=4 Tax=Enterobacteriaceae TaxID=543 RepID=A0A485BNP1_RAOPL|nr:Predicted membrane protein [Raoultella planticola]